MKPSRPTRRERERDRHREEILDAALRVLSARGIDGLTIEGVAREAEFAVGSIYRHFSSKEEMVESLFVHLTQPLFSEVEALAAASDPFENVSRRGWPRPRSREG
jgi:AcrR family transcriptional regulator